MRFWTSLTSHFHTNHHARVSSQPSELSETAKGKQKEYVAQPDVEAQKAVHFKKGRRAKGNRLTRKHDRSSYSSYASGERLRKSVDE
jgi:hypothetical protein